MNAVCVGAVALAFIFACGSVLQYNSWADANNHQPYQKILYTWLGSDTGLSNYVKHDGRPGISGRMPAFCSIPSQHLAAVRDRRRAC